MREPLLTVHILSVIVWLGCGLYEIFLAKELKRARGSALEVSLARIYLKYALAVPVATLLVAITGVTMAVTLDWGFFQQLWLGTKQVLMIGVLLIFAGVIPAFNRFGDMVKSLPENANELPAAAAETFYRLEPWLITMRVMGTVAVVLAVFKIYI